MQHANDILFPFDKGKQLNLILLITHKSEMSSDCSITKP